MQASATFLDISANDGGVMPNDRALKAIEAAFFSPAHPEAITVDAAVVPSLAASLRLEPTEGSRGDAVGKQLMRIKREDFLQCARAWLRAPRVERGQEAYVMSGPVQHPQRPDRPAGLVYSRHVPHLNSHLTFRGLNAGRDQEHLHAWMNNERVNTFWRMKGPPEVHRRLLHALLTDKHAQPLIGEFDGTPFGYFDVYWAKEDKVGQYYDATDFDRGIHMLVGEDQFRGPHRVAGWLPSLAHYAFLDEPRTQRLVCEPQIDNARMIDYLRRFGFTDIGPIDFPHKKALLLILTRETFLQGGMRPDFSQAGS
jgi:RimJ/RimL family protein N-acetyltransferase